jgi:hypothetical protein
LTERTAVNVHVYIVAREESHVRILSIDITPMMVVGESCLRDDTRPLHQRLIGSWSNHEKTGGGNPLQLIATQAAGLVLEVEIGAAA